MVSDCAKVYSYLDSQSKALSSWASSPIWSVVDGPWKLASFNPDGNSAFVPNQAYSGPVKPTLAEFEEVPFTTESAEYNVLQAGAAGGQKLDVGYLPTTDAPTKPADAAVGANPLSGYTLAPLIQWAINYFPVNFQSTTGNGRGHQAAVLPAGAAVPDEPEGHHRRPAARVRGVHGRAGRDLSRRPVTYRRGQAG